jgi:hypothetical protein
MRPSPIHSRFDCHSARGQLRGHRVGLHSHVFQQLDSPSWLQNVSPEVWFARDGSNPLSGGHANHPT